MMEHLDLDPSMEMSSCRRDTIFRPLRPSALASMWTRVEEETCLCQASNKITQHYLFNSLKLTYFYNTII